MEMLGGNHSTQAVYEEWHKQSSIFEHETQQNKEALDLLTSSSKDARCPTCDQRFVGHTPEHRMQYLGSWLNVTQHHRQEELLQRKQRIDAGKHQRG